MLLGLATPGRHPFCQAALNSATWEMPPFCKVFRRFRRPETVGKPCKKGISGVSGDGQIMQGSFSDLCSLSWDLFWSPNVHVPESRLGTSCAKKWVQPPMGPFSTMAQCSSFWGWADHARGFWGWADHARILQNLRASVGRSCKCARP